MAGGNHPKSTSTKPPSFSSSSHHRKSRWESNPNTKSPSKSKPSPATTSAVAAAVDPKPPQKPPSKPYPNTATNNKVAASGTPSQASRPGPNPSPVAYQTPQSGKINQIPQPGGLIPFPDYSQLGPLPPPSYGFHMLDRRTIVLPDGSVRSYFALPPDYHDSAMPMRPPLPMDPAGRFMGPGGGRMSPELLRGERPDFYGRGRQNQDYWNSLGLDGRGGGPPHEGMLKRKYGEEEKERRDGFGRDSNDDYARHRQQLLQYGNVGMNSNGYPLGPGDKGEFLAGPTNQFGRDGDEMRASKHMRIGERYDNVALKHNEGDQKALKAAFLRFVKVINENTNQRKIYMEDGKKEPVKCVACGRSSKDFPDMHGLIMHTYHSDNVDLRVDHLGLHKALCVLMGWNYSRSPDNSKAYQMLSPEEVTATQSDLIMWPPVVFIHNTWSAKGRDGRFEGLGNNTIDAMLRDLGCRGGKSKVLYGKDGLHQGIIMVKFSGDQAGLKEAFRLAEYFDKENHGRRSWSHIQSMTGGKDDDNNPNLVKVDERTREKKRIFYGYIGTASDLDKIDSETRKKVVVESLREYMMMSK